MSRAHKLETIDKLYKAQIIEDNPVYKALVVTGPREGYMYVN